MKPLQAVGVSFPLASGNRKLASNLKKEFSAQQWALGQSGRVAHKEPVMIFRAVFWIGLVALLAPHEPDLGLGHPGAGTSNVSSATLSSTVESLLRADKDCGSRCAGGLGPSDFLHLRVDGDVVRGLAEVKAEIAADQRARAESNSRL